MFERYTEKARRTIFFSRYEASQLGSPLIETEHLLLGLLRENKALHRWIPRASAEHLRRQIEQHLPPKEPTSTSVDLPLSGSAKHVLKEAAEEADSLSHKHIGTEHLFLALLEEENSFTAKLLKESGADAALIRKHCVDHPEHLTVPRVPLGGQLQERLRGRGYRAPSGEKIEIHGRRWNVEYVRDAVNRCLADNWHWQKTQWAPRDVAIERKTGRASFDLRLANDSVNFELVKGGRKKDHCFVCRWELCQSDDTQHNTGYTNGHDWVCAECYTKFFERPDFFDSAYPEIT
jgi:hypothetical protein